jgi:death-on-curing protein
MPDTVYLTAADVRALANAYLRRLGYAAPILRGNGEALLESAIHRARTAAYYGAADLIQQAAALTNGIALNHPFLDGNKRSAWITCITFLELNGLPLPEEAYDPLAQQLIAQHEQTDRSKADEILAEWLREHLPPI